MKLFVKLPIAILVIGLLLLPFTFLQGKDGKPLLSFTDFHLPEISLPDISLPDFSSKDMPKLRDGIQSPGGELPASADVIYKWTDAEGNLQFSNIPPPEGIEYTVKGYDPNLNVIQAVEVESQKPEEMLENESEKKATNAKDIGNPYSVETIEKLFEDANNIEKLLNQRLDKQEAVIGQ